MPDVETVAINGGWFADNYMGVLPMAAQLGIFPYRLGEAKVAPVSSEDIARVAVGALVNPAPHVGRYYRPTGPELLGPDQLAATFAKVLERPVKYQELSERMFFKAVKSAGLTVHPHHMAQLRYYIEDYRRGSFALGAVNDTVREVGGAEPEDFETIVRRHAETDPMTTLSLANKLRAVAGFIKILLTPAPDLAGYERSHHQLLLRAPEYGIDNAAWRATHDMTGAFGTTGSPELGHIRIPTRNAEIIDLATGTDHRRRRPLF